MLGEDFSGPLETGLQKYNQLVEYSTKLAIAAENHPEIVYTRSDEFQDLPTTFQGEQEYNPDMKQAAEELPLLSYFTSNAWSEAQEYFMFDMETELRQHLSEEEIDDYEKQQQHDYFIKINAMYDMLENELQELNEEIAEILENPPAQQTTGQTSFTLRQKTSTAAD